MGVLDDAFAHLKGKVQAGEIGIALLQLLHRAQGIQVVVKAIAIFAHSVVQGSLSRVSKGRMPDIMDQGQSLNQIFIQL